MAVHNSIIILLISDTVYVVQPLPSESATFPLFCDQVGKVFNPVIPVRVVAIQVTQIACLMPNRLDMLEHGLCLADMSLD